jgi:hypothetical protein
MSSCTLQVESAVFGSAAAGACPPPVSLRLELDRISVRDLIRLAVEAQVEQLMQERAATAASVALTLSRHYLSEGDIERQARDGAVAMPKAQPGLMRDVDLKAAVAHAWRGFADGAFRVAVGGQMYIGLDEQVPLAATAEAVFLRLTPLKGG